MAMYDINNFSFDNHWSYYKKSRLFFKGLYSIFKCKKKEFNMGSLENIQLGKDGKYLRFLTIFI